MRRRDLLAGALALAGPPSASGQGATKHVAVLQGFAAGDPEVADRMRVLREALAGFGWTEGRNLVLTLRFVEGQGYDRVAADLVAPRPDLLLAGSTPSLRALQRATREIPIVFTSVSDPVGDGFIQSLGRPGGNITGFSNYEPGLGAKWVELLRETAPGTRRIAILYNPETGPARLFRPPVAAAIAAAGLDPVDMAVRSAEEIELGFAEFAGRPGTGLVALPDIFIGIHRELVGRLALARRIPAIFPFRYLVAAGGLMSYGANQIDQFRRAATYIDRILKGDRPGDLPVQAPVAFDFVVNLKAASALGLTLSQTLLARADEVIE